MSLLRSQIQVVVLNVAVSDNKPTAELSFLRSCYIPNTGCRIECEVKDNKPTPVGVGACVQVTSQIQVAQTYGLITSQSCWS
jgi:hypothetical protein